MVVVVVWRTASSLVGCCGGGVWNAELAFDANNGVSCHVVSCDAMKSLLIGMALQKSSRDNGVKGVKIRKKGKMNRQIPVRRGHHVYNGL